MLDRLASEVNAVPGALVSIRVEGDGVTSALVVAGDGDGITLRLTDPLADA